MQLKSIQAIHKGRVINLELPDKKSIVLNGSRKDCNYILDLSKVMLGVDYNSSLPYVENRSEDILNDSASMRFTTGSILLKDGSITIQGKIPYIHVVQVTNNGGISSFLVSQSLNPTGLAVDMTKFSNAIEIADWIRLVELFNRYAKFECAILENNGDNNFSLRFNGLTEELKTVYLLMSESFLTPKDYLRVVLLPEINGINADRMFELIELTDNITKLEMIICGADVEIKDGSVITPVNC